MPLYSKFVIGSQIYVKRLFETTRLKNKSFVTYRIMFHISKFIKIYFSTLYHRCKQLNSKSMYFVVSFKKKKKITLNIVVDGYFKQ